MCTKKIMVLILAGAILVSCSSAPAATPTPTEILATVTKTRTPKPTATKTPEKTKTPTATATQEMMSLPIVSKLDLEKLSELPFVSAEDAVSPEFDAFIMQAFNEGKLGEFPIHAEPFAVASPADVIGGFDPAALNPAWLIPTDLLQSGRYTDMTIRPYLLLNSFFQTKVGTQDSLLYAQVWRNADGSQVLIKYVLSFENVRGFSFYQRATTNVETHLLVPMFIPSEANTDWSGQPWFDSIFYNTYWLKNFNNIQTMLDSVYKTGNIPSDVSRYLFYPVSLRIHN